MPEQSQDCLRLGHILDLTVISLASVLQPREQPEELGFPGSGLASFTASLPLAIQEA